MYPTEKARESVFPLTKTLMPDKILPWHLREAIELGMTLKFPGDIEAVMIRINKINDADTLAEIKQAIKTAKDSSEILALLK